MQLSKNLLFFGGRGYIKMSDIENHLFSLQDKAYKDFEAKLIPSIKAESVIGVRTPLLKKYAKELFFSGEYETFFKEVPHKYFEENQLHAFIISQIKDFDSCIDKVEHFLPFIDNWATCDQLSPTVFKKHKAELLPHICSWINSKDVYTVRFAIGMLMKHFLGENFSLAYADMVLSVHSEEYYINMMIAWYFATALSMHYTEVLPIIKEKKLSAWTQNKTIQKAKESYRIKREQKDELSKLKI